jgi:predicted RNA-binding protein associated with RNAse of E/G family
VPCTGYSVLIFQYGGQVRQWYVNLEQPLQRTTLGFDYEDQILDAIVAPDRRSWRWDDEDELEEALQAGLVSRELAIDLYARGTAAVDAPQSGTSVFNAWENWRPDPSWGVPDLPPAWSRPDNN